MNAIDKIRDEMAKSKDKKIDYLGEGMTALLRIHPEYAEKVAAKDKTLSGCLEAIKRGAKGGVSDPAMTTKAICSYYGIKCESVERLAVEVHLAMLGGEIPQTPALVREQEKPAMRDEFDLDAMLRTAATAQRASGGSAGLESGGFAPAGRACAKAQRRDCSEGGL